MKGVTSGAELYERMIAAGHQPVKSKAPRKRTKAATKSAADMLASIRRQTMPKEKPKAAPAKPFSGVPYIMRRLRDEYGATTVEGVLAAWEDRYVPSLTPPGPPKEMLMAEARAAIEELLGTGDAVTA